MAPAKIARPSMRLERFCEDIGAGRENSRLRLTGGEPRLTTRDSPCSPANRDKTGALSAFGPMHASRASPPLKRSTQRTGTLRIPPVLILRPKALNDLTPPIVAPISTSGNSVRRKGANGENQTIRTRYEPQNSLKFQRVTRTLPIDFDH